LTAACLLYAALALPGLSWQPLRWLALGFALVLVLKLAAALSAPPLGVKASYWAGATPSGSPEASTDFSGIGLPGRPALADATRVDSALDLRGEAFAVHFFNDAARFNFGTDVQPARDQLPFSVRWDGWLLVPTDGQRRFVLSANGPADAWLDDVQLPAADAQVDLSSGLHRLRVDYTRPEASVPALHLSWQRDPGGELETVAAPDARWQPSDASGQISATLGVVVDIGLALIVLAWLGIALARTRYGGRLKAAVGAVPLVFLVYAMLLEAPVAGRATVLSGLDDWLIYESSARDILLHGPLMDAGQGHAAPFYGQPLYPYVLALTHWLTGESLYGPLVVQFAALGSVVAGTFALARRAFGTPLDGFGALAAFWLLLVLEPEHFKIARQLFNENLYMPLVMASLVVLVSLARRPVPPTWWQSLLVGLLLGATTISRSQFLLCVPLCLLIVFIAWRQQTRLALAGTALIALGLVLAVAPVTARNWLVSGQFVPITSNAGASLLEFHRPPPGLIDSSALQHDPLFDALHLDEQTRTVLAFVRADPVGYLKTWLPLAAHSVGLQGRNDPGIYWPLLVTVLVYVGSFALRSTRQLHVWPIHAFVLTHLLVLALFEADTYGYRLVMPMYAPMVAVAAQLPLAVVRGARIRLRGTAHGVDVGLAQRFAVAGWSVLLLAAVAWQIGGLVSGWSDRETAFHGLGGAAAHAAHTSDHAAADVIYVASVDGTPRRFGAGVLPGLRYPWFKWFDPARSLPLPAPTRTAVYMLSELSGQPQSGVLTACLGAADASSEVVIRGDQARQECASQVVSQTPMPTVFDGVARFDAVQVPATAAAGQALDARLVWEPLVAHPEARQVSLQLDDPTSGDATLWGNGTLELYPANEWQPDESLLSSLPIATDPTALPQPYRLTLGIRPARANAPPDLASWQGARTDRVPVSTVALSPGSGVVAQVLPADMHALEGQPLVDGGLELVAASPLPAQVAIGSPLRIGLLWRAVQDAPPAAPFTVRLVRDSGEVVQETRLPVLGGRVAPSALHAGNVVRDEQSVLIQPQQPDATAEALGLELLAGAPGDDSSSDASSIRLGSLTLTGRAHVMDTSGVQPEATFGGAMELLSDELAPPRVKAGDQVTVKLRWRSGATLGQAYKVFVHVLDPSGQRVVAQRDAEPQDGKAPTTSWVANEVIDDQYAIAVPADLVAADYPVEVGVYDPKTGDRLPLANGDNHMVLSTRLHVTR
jgi:hypothetical protein